MTALRMARSIARVPSTATVSTMACEPTSAGSAASPPVATVKIVSPSLVVCTGLMARAYASCTIAETFVAWAFVNVAFVMTHPMVVLPENGLSSAPAAFAASAASNMRSNASSAESMRTPPVVSPTPASAFTFALSSDHLLAPAGSPAPAIPFVPAGPFVPASPLASAHPLAPPDPLAPADPFAPAHPLALTNPSSSGQRVPAIVVPSSAMT